MRKKIPFQLTAEQRLAIILAMRQAKPPISDSQIGQVFGITRQAVHQLAGERPVDPQQVDLHSAIGWMLEGQRISAVAGKLDISEQTLRKRLTTVPLPANFWLRVRQAIAQERYLKVRAELLEFLDQARTPTGDSLPLTATYLRGWDSRAYNRAVVIQPLPTWRADLGLTGTVDRTNYPVIKRRSPAREKRKKG